MALESGTRPGRTADDFTRWLHGAWDTEYDKIMDQYTGVAEVGANGSVRSAHTYTDADTGGWSGPAFSAHIAQLLAERQRAQIAEIHVPEGWTLELGDPEYSMGEDFDLHNDTATIKVRQRWRLIRVVGPDPGVRP